MIPASSHFSFEKMYALTVKGRTETSDLSSLDTDSLEGLGGPQEPALGVDDQRVCSARTLRRVPNMLVILLAPHPQLSLLPTLLCCVPGMRSPPASCCVWPMGVASRGERRDSALCLWCGASLQDCSSSRAAPAPGLQPSPHSQRFGS